MPPLLRQKCRICAWLVNRRVHIALSCDVIVHNFENREALAVTEVGTQLPVFRWYSKNPVHDVSFVLLCVLLSKSSSRTLAFTAARPLTVRHIILPRKTETNSSSSEERNDSYNCPRSQGPGQASAGSSRPPAGSRYFFVRLNTPSQSGVGGVFLNFRERSR